MPVVETKGSASSQGFGEFAKSGGPANYIEDVFSTYLYTGNASTQTITNGIDLSTKGGLVWLKNRGAAASNALFDTQRGVNKLLRSDLTDAQFTGSSAYGVTAFNSNGFSFQVANPSWNDNTNTYVSWTFRKQAKFFDVVTYTGNGANRTIAHNLGSVPGCIIIKSTSNTSNWAVYHRGLTDASYYVVLNRTDAQASNTAFWNSTAPTATEFSLGTIGTVNGNGLTYVAYLFAHDAGGFGLTGTDNVISCGSVSVASGASNAVVNLGYEPQWVLWRNADVTDNWYVFDNMRGIGAFNTAQQLNPNLSDAESAIGSSTYPINITSTGFSFNAGNFGWGASSNKFIYIAIRRGPMKTPTSGTSVFVPLVIPANSASATTPINAGLTTDTVFGSHNSDESGGKYFANRLTADYRLDSTSTSQEALGAYYWDNMVGVRQQETNAQPTWYFLRRAPNFFDEVCWYGDPATVTHNLNAVPEWIIQKNRTTTQAWAVWRPGINYGFLNTTAAFTTYTSGSATSTTFTPLQTGSGTSNFVAYLFATCPGVSKVGSYTGTGTTLQIDCGFTGGARFVLIKRTDSTGDWYVWDSARGIVSGNDPYLLLNSTAAEVTNTDYVDTYSAGFEISSTAPAAINANGGSFIFLAIA